MGTSEVSVGSCTFRIIKQGHGRVDDKRSTIKHNVETKKRGWGPTMGVKSRLCNHCTVPYCERKNFFVFALNA